VREKKGGKRFANGNKTERLAKTLFIVLHNRLGPIGKRDFFFGDITQGIDKQNIQKRNTNERR
jgi:hypothetical protein